MKPLFALNKYFFKYKYRLLLGVVFVTAANIFGVLPPQVIRYAFDLVKEQILYYQLFRDFDLQPTYYSVFSSVILFFGLAVLGLAIIRGIFMFLMRQTIIVMSRLIEFDLRNDMYEHYQKLSTSFYKRNRTGDMMSRITEDVSKVRMYLGPAIMYSINLTVLILIVVSTMFSVNAELTFYVLLPLPLLSISIFYVNTLINQRSEKIQEQLSNLTNTAQESFSGIRVLKAYTQEENTNAYFESESENYKIKSLDLAKIQALFFPLMLFLIGISVILTVYIGGQQVIDGKISAGNIAEFVIYVNMLTWPVTSIGWVASIIQRAAASQKRINEFLQETPDIISSTETSIQLKGNIEFNKLSFTYPDTGIEALKNINFKIKQGQKLAIVGRTGSGKSTIADLLIRKYDPTNGSVLIDDNDVRNISLSSLRKDIGYVPQDVFLFSDTIKNNIAFGLNTVKDHQIELAAQQAAVAKDIEQLPEKYSTVVGERGVTLSGGQKQRISLARALIKQPEILVFDDCLSAVDAETEQHIIDHLNKFLSNKTAVIITHRIFSLLQFDHILVLDKGQIVEQGTHEELMKLQGSYYDLHEKQNSRGKKIVF